MGAPLILKNGNLYLLRFPRGVSAVWSVLDYDEAVIEGYSRDASRPQLASII